MSPLASWRVRALAAVFAVLAGACGGGGGGGGADGPAPTPPPSPAPPPTPGPPPTPTPPPPTGGSGPVLTGTVFAAATAGATVSAYAADARGQPAGAALAAAQADGNGNYSLQLPAAPAGAVVLVSNGGSYASEADGSNQPGAGFAVLVPALPGAGASAQLNPLTTAIASRAAALMAGGASPAAAVSDATTSVERLLGVSAIAGDPQTLAPQPIATGGDAWWLSALAGSLEQLRAATGIASPDLYRALAEDIADGALDGANAGRPVALGAGRTLVASLFTSELAGAANAWAASHPAYRAAAAGIVAALQGSAQLAGVFASGSGGAAQLQTQAGGTQVFFAARGDGLVRLDVRDPANPVAARMGAINQAVLGGILDSIDGLVINPTPVTVNGRAAVYGILYSYNSPTVVAVNLSDGVVVGSVTLPLSAMLSYTAADTWIAGGIADGQRGLVWLATADGLVGVDPAHPGTAPVRIAQPPGTVISENIGADAAANIVFSPDYEGNGIVVFNLAEGTAYVMNGGAWRALGGGVFGDPGELAAAALDSRYRVAIVTPEAGTTAALVGYATPSGAAGATGTFSATGFRSVDLPGLVAGAAVDPVTHTALFVGSGSGLGAGVLDNPANPGWRGLSAFVYANGSYEFEPHVPHTLAVANIGGRSYGFLLAGHGPYQAVVLDLAAMLAAPAAGGVLAGDPLADPAIARVVDY